MSELSKQWDTLSDVEKSNISFNLAESDHTCVLRQIHARSASNLTRSCNSFINLYYTICKVMRYTLRYCLNSIWNTHQSNILGAVKLYANAKESADSILQKSQPAIMLSNVTGFSGEESAKYLQTIMNQFEYSFAQLPSKGTLPPAASISAFNFVYLDVKSSILARNWMTPRQ